MMRVPVEVRGVSRAGSRHGWGTCFCVLRGATGAAAIAASLLLPLSRTVAQDEIDRQRHVPSPRERRRDSDLWADTLYALDPSYPHEGPSYGYDLVVTRTGAQVTFGPPNTTLSRLASSCAGTICAATCCLMGTWRQSRSATALALLHRHRLCVL